MVLVIYKAVFNMSKRISLTIENRQSENNNAVHMVNQQHNNKFYCDEIILIADDKQTKLLSNTEEYLLKNNDEIITKDHVIKINITDQWDDKINYNEHRAPVATMNQHWNENTTETNRSTFTEDFTTTGNTNQLQSIDDPLHFLVNTTPHSSHNHLLDSNELNISGINSAVDDVNNLFLLEDVKKAPINNPLLENTGINSHNRKKLTEFPNTEYENKLLAHAATTEQKEVRLNNKISTNIKKKINNFFREFM